MEDILFLAACPAVNVEDIRMRIFIIFLAACPAVNNINDIRTPWTDFLSCLSGSERGRAACTAVGWRRREQAHVFLSCLSGSELCTAVTKAC